MTELKVDKATIIAADFNMAPSLTIEETEKWHDLENLNSKGRSLNHFCDGTGLAVCPLLHAPTRRILGGISHL